MRSFPELGVAEVQIDPRDAVSPGFAACFAPLTAKFERFPVGSDCIGCGDDGGSAQIIYPFTVDTE